MRLDPTDGGGVDGKAVLNHLEIRGSIHIYQDPESLHDGHLWFSGIEEDESINSSIMLSVRGAACGSDPAWQPTISAYTTADTDNQLRNYYQGWQSNPQRPFTNTLAKSFGSGPTGYMCGIGLQGSCGTQIGCDSRCLSSE